MVSTFLWLKCLLQKVEEVCFILLWGRVDKLQFRITVRLTGSFELSAFCFACCFLFLRRRCFEGCSPTARSFFVSFSLRQASSDKPSIKTYIDYVYMCRYTHHLVKWQFQLDQPYPPLSFQDLFCLRDMIQLDYAKCLQQGY